MIDCDEIRVPIAPRFKAPDSSKWALLLLLLSSSVCTLAAAQSPSSQEELCSFIAAQSIIESLSSRLSDQVKGSSDEHLWIVESGDWVAVLARVVRAHVDPDAGVEAQMGRFRAESARTLAVHGLYAHELSQRFSAARFGDREILASALASLYEKGKMTGKIAAGLQSQMNTIQGDGVALLWCPAEIVTVSARSVLDSKQLSDCYCELLGLRTTLLLSQGSLAEAAVRFGELSRLQCIDVNQSIQYAGVLHKLARTKEGQDVVREAWQAFAESFDTVQAERLGDVALELGEEAIAKAAYDLALKLIR